MMPNPIPRADARERRLAIAGWSFGELEKERPKTELKTGRMILGAMMIPTVVATACIIWYKRDRAR